MISPRRLFAPIAAAALTLAGIAGHDRWEAWVADTALPSLALETSAEVLDRDGILLRAYTAGDGVWRMKTSVQDVDPRYVTLLLAHEDKRFFHHSGVDLRAVLRATGQAAWNGEVISGASTLTMQVARLLEASGTGAIKGKLRQMRVAWALEKHLSKTEILDLYLTLAPFGGNIEGVRAASFAYFGKPPARLTLAQAAVLVALPQSPETRRPDRNAAALKTARDRILRLAAAKGLLNAQDQAASLAAAIPHQRRPFPALAAHVADRSKTAQTTLSAPLQIQLEALAQTARPTLPKGASIAILAVDHQSGETLASVSGFGLDPSNPAAFVDLTRATRSPGSTLKPLVYALAFDQGLAHPQTIVSDRPVQFGTYAPQNFDGQFRGDVTMAQALQYSLNTPVVQLLDSLGPARLMVAMEQAGVEATLPGNTPGLAMALGGVGTSLEGLVRLYAMLARQGRAQDYQTTPVVVPRAAWAVGNILQATPRPRSHTRAAPEVAYKTGTSYGHRDAWALGYDGRHVVGVWIGRPDGTPMPGAFGTDMAAPVLFDAFARISPQRTPLPAPPKEALTVTTAELPSGLQRFGKDAQSLEISFPPEGAALLSGLPLTARLRHGQGPYVWLANGKPVAKSRARTVELPTLEPGFHRLTVIDALGQSQSAAIRILAD